MYSNLGSIRSSVFQGMPHTPVGVVVGYVMKGQTVSNSSLQGCVSGLSAVSINQCWGQGTPWKGFKKKIINWCIWVDSEDQKFQIDYQTLLPLIVLCIHDWGD